MDFKGWWSRLTVRDAHSRKLLAVQLVRSTSAAEARRVFEDLFQRYGMPVAILSDNGPPFAVTADLAGLTQLSAWWIALGIRFVRGRVGCPQDNGGHERMHRDMKAELQAHPEATVEAQQAACDVWRHEFNARRPHEALDMNTPDSVYRRSTWPYPLELGHWSTRRASIFGRSAPPERCANRLPAPAKQGGRRSRLRSHRSQRSSRGS